MKVYKEFYVEDMLYLLEQARNNNHLSSECVDSDLASLLYDFFDGLGEVNEDNMYDFIRFEMQVQTEEEIKENYKHLFEEYAFENGDEVTSEDIEDFLSYHTTYIGQYESNGTTYHVFSEF